jgi:hypothetical protein
MQRKIEAVPLRRSLSCTANEKNINYEAQLQKKSSTEAQLAATGVAKEKQQ